MDKYEALISYPQQHLHAIRINFKFFFTTILLKSTVLSHYIDTISLITSKKIKMPQNCRKNLHSASNFLNFLFHNIFF